MKKHMLLLIILLLTIMQNAFSYDLPTSGLYLIPTTSSAINLRSKHYPLRDAWIEADGAVKDGFAWMRGDDSQNGNVPLPYDEYTELSGNGQYFYDKNIILSGGFSYNDTSNDGNLPWDNKNPTDTEANIRTALNEGTIEFSVTTDTGDMELVSLSNSSYRRPFVLYILVTSNNYHNTNGGNPQRNSLIKIESTNTMCASNKLELGDDDIRFGSSVYFDLILALPGEFDKGTTILKDGSKMYMLSEADDYSAMVTINMEFFDKDHSLIASKSITIPFSGYISLDEQYTSTFASMAVNLYPIASVIDIESNAGSRFAIASFNFMANYGLTSGQNYTNHLVNEADPNVSLFISSNKSPFVGGTDNDKFKFILKKDEINGVMLSESNSIGFTLDMQTSDGQNASFDGSGYVEETSDTAQTSYVNTQRENGDVKHTGGKVYHYHYLDGDIFMTLDPTKGIMKEGLYEETVYIHVVTGLQ